MVCRKKLDKAGTKKNGKGVKGDRETVKKNNAGKGSSKEKANAGQPKHRLPAFEEYQQRYGNSSVRSMLQFSFLQLSFMVTHDKSFHQKCKDIKKCVMNFVIGT